MRNPSACWAKWPGTTIPGSLTGRSGCSNHYGPKAPDTTRPNLSSPIGSWAKTGGGNLILSRAISSGWNTANHGDTSWNPQPDLPTNPIQPTGTPAIMAKPGTPDSSPWSQGSRTISAQPRSHTWMAGWSSAPRPVPSVWMSWRATRRPRSAPMRSGPDTGPCHPTG